jgi:hypothetical protein
MQQNNKFIYVLLGVIIVLFCVVIFLLIRQSNKEVPRDTSFSDLVEAEKIKQQNEDAAKTQTQTKPVANTNLVPNENNTPPSAPVYQIPKGWKEYKNDELGFSFAYPASWGSVTISEEYGSRGKILLGSIKSGSVINHFSFGLETKDYYPPFGVGFDGDTIPSKGYDENSLTNSSQIVYSSTGDKGILIPFNIMGYDEPQGYKVIFNLKKSYPGIGFGGGAGSNKIPEFMDVIKTLRIY